MRIKKPPALTLTVLFFCLALHQLFAELVQNLMLREPLKTSVFRGNFENATFKSPQFRAFKLDGNLKLQFLEVALRFRLYQSLSDHSLSNLNEASDVSTCYIVTFGCILLCSVVSVVVDVCHNLLEFCINFFERP